MSNDRSDEPLGGRTPSKSGLIHPSADHLWAAALMACMKGPKHESREGSTREVLAWTGTMASSERTLVTSSARALDPGYAAAEVLWYISGRSDSKAVEPWAPSYARWADADGRQHGAVGGRLAPDAAGSWHADAKDALGECATGGPSKPAHHCVSGQLEAAAELLARNPDTRRAVLSFWRPGDLLQSLGGFRRNVPCYLGVALNARDGEVHALTTMRSNDAWLGMPYDVFAFSCLQRFVAEAAGLRAGSYVHVAASLHLYEKHSQRALATLEAGEAGGDYLEHGWAADPIPEARRGAAQAARLRAIAADALKGLQERHTVSFSAKSICDFASSCAVEASAAGSKMVRDLIVAAGAGLLRRMGHGEAARELAARLPSPAPLSALLREPGEGP